MRAHRQGPRRSAPAPADLPTAPNAGPAGDGRRAAALGLGLVAFLAVWLGALSSVAQAAPISGYEVQSTRMTVDPGTTPVDVTASCTVGKQVTGGGFHVEEPNDLRLYASEPGDALGLSDHSWHALVRNAGSRSELITVYAVCISAPLTGYEQIAATRTLASGQTTDVLASCTSGNQVVGGGFRLGDPDTVGLFATEPTNGAAVISDHNWDVIAHNGGTGSQQVTSTAICLTGPLDGYEEPTHRAMVPTGTIADVTGTCSAGNRAVGGGFDVETPADVKAFSSEPTDASGTLSDQSWSSLVRNDGTGTEQTTVTAICATAPTPAPTVTGVGPSSGPESGGTTVTITGTDFIGATAVDFGQTPASFFSVVSSTEITATSPPGTGTVEVTVATPGGTSAANPPADRFKYLPVPAITTAINQTGPLALGATFTDTATVAAAGGPAPTGTVTFDVFGPNGGSECSGPPTFTDTQTLASGTATSSPFTGTDAGGYQVVAHYSGDATYFPASSNCFDSAESISVSRAAPALTTQVSQDPITQGDAFTDTATLAPVPPGATPPTGTVTFNVFGPNDTTACDTTPVLTSIASVAASGTANSDPLIPPSPGTYKIVASYAGDPNYAPAANACGDETVTVRVPGPTITTQVSPASIALGQSFGDTATLSAPGNLSPTGTVTFSVYGPGDPTCSTDPVLTAVRSLDGSTVSSGPLVPTAPGTYQVIASYSGDGNFDPSKTACGDPNDAVTVGPAAAAITTAVSSTPIAFGGGFHDTATLTPPTGLPAPTGQVSFAVYGPADPTCAGPPAFTSTDPLNPAGTTAVSGTFTPATAGTYRAIASYPGDANFAAASTGCGDPGEVVVVDRAASLGITTVATVGAGGSFSDAATLAGAPAGAAAPTGQVTFSVYGPGDAACAGAPAFTSTNPVSAAGTQAVSDSFRATPASGGPGSYRFVAAYGGDANYPPVAGTCNAANESVSIPAPAIAVTKTAAPPTQVEPGGTFTFTVAVSNPSTVDPIRITSLVDNVYGDVATRPGSTCGSLIGVTLAPGPASGSCSFTGPFTGTAGASQTDTVRASGADVNGFTATATAQATVTLTPRPPPVLGVTVSPSPASRVEPGGDFAFTVQVANSSATTPVTIAKLVDDDYGDLAARPGSTCGTLIGVTLAPGASTPPCSFTGPFTGVAGASQTDTVTATGVNGGATVTGTAQATVTLTPAPPPAPLVGGLSPASGPGAGGTAVTIAGTDLAGATGVAFGGTPASGFTVDGPSQITATAPAGSGTVDVTVTTPAGTSPATAADQYAYTAGPGGTTTTGGTPPPGPPRTVAGPPKVISSSSAGFTATINPDGLATTMHFEYAVELPGGASAAAIAYDAQTPEQVVGSDFVDHTVTAQVASLLANSTYHVRAVAANPSGVSPSPDATFKTAADPPPPPPVLGRAVNAEPISGIVYVLLPGTGHVAQAHVSAAKGVGFVPLTEARQLPVGTIFDATAGVARLTSATVVQGQPQTGDFGGGLFKVLQSRRERGLTELDLVVSASRAKTCPSIGKTAARAAATKALPKAVLNLLRGSDSKGRFRTKGRFSSATVRGTVWTTSDRCDGTLTTVKRGSVVVSDFRRKRQIVVRAGRSYLARAR